MKEMIRRFLRQKLGSIGLAIALLLFCLLMAGPLAVSGGMAPAFGVGTVVVFLLAAGIVSRDVSGGAVQMILSRPLRRTCPSSEGATSRSTPTSVPTSASAPSSCARSRQGISRR